MPLYEINAGAPGDGVKPRLIHAKTQVGPPAVCGQGHHQCDEGHTAARLDTRGAWGKIENAPAGSHDNGGE